ncbi:MAG TPA: SDR family oxidoreductase, partial [Azonexus sp.]
EQGFIGLGGELAAARLDSDLVAHRFPLVVGYNAGVQKILIVGSGDVARRILSRLAGRYRVYALLRDRQQCAAWRVAGAVPLIGDLDDRASLHRLAGLAEVVLHLAPPPCEGSLDTRTRHLLAALSAGGSLPRQLIYVSTTGVYGDCAGALIDETRPCRAQNARAVRRVDAESCLREWGRRCGVRVCILRAPGIYAADRLPLERLQKGLPALLAAEDAYSNHIHAEDLAAACVAALRHGDANRVYNAVDDSQLRMADYFDRVADAFALARPPRLSRSAAAEILSPLQLSFMRESRRIGNRRLKQELKLRLAYPTVADGIAEAAAGRNACSS